MKLGACVSSVMAELGGNLPDGILTYADASTEFLSVRALELQKMGISSTNVTSDHIVINPPSREGLLPTYPSIPYVDVIPSFVELIPKNISTNSYIRYKVEIVPVESIPEYEGARAIAFFGMPRKYRLAFDVWDSGSLDLWYDGVEDITTKDVTSDVTFPPAFWTFLFKKTALNLISKAMLRLSYNTSPQTRKLAGDLTNGLKMAAEGLAMQVKEWELEMMKFRNLDLNTQPHLRRTHEEILLSDYNNITGFTPGDAS
jgi:hypothetical protein